jgi:NitT/TauT family transport system ATP-binding protein
MTNRPGRIKEIINIDLPRPRTEEIRNSIEFAKIRKDLWGLLQNEAIQVQSYGAYL